MIGLSRIGLQVVRRSGSTSHLLHPGERRQGTSIIVHIDDTAISRPKPCVPPSYSTCFRAETRVHFCFLIISYTRAFDPKTPTVSPCSGTAYSFCALMLRSSHNTSGATLSSKHIRAPVLSLSALARTGVANVQISRWVLVTYCTTVNDPGRTL
jgi:hypothetical protein